MSEFETQVLAILSSINDNLEDIANGIQVKLSVDDHNMVSLGMDAITDAIANKN